MKLQISLLVSIKTVAVPTKTASIGANAFDGCTSLTSVAIYNTNPTVADTAFSGVTAMLTAQPNLLKQVSANTTNESGAYSWAGGTFTLTRGYCGAAGNVENISWSLSSDKKTLTIGGAGAMTDWSSENRPGWYSAKDTIETVTIGGSVARMPSPA